MNQDQPLKKIALLASLYVSQTLPVMFLFQALPVFMRQEGSSLGEIGSLSLIGLPLILKFLWSPLIDRYSFKRWGHYRFWIICFQLLLACMTIVCAFTNLETNFRVVLICGFLMGFCGSSQDIATDALAVRLLDTNEKGWGNAVQKGGGYLGAVIGGGGMLILLNRWGWTASLLMLALVVVLALLPILQYKESTKSPKQPSDSTSPLRTLIKFFRRPKMGLWLLFLGLYMTGGAMANAMFRPLLVDIGLSLADIGLLLGVASYSAGILGAITGGLSIVPLGRRRSLIVFGLLQAFAIFIYLLPVLGIHNLLGLYLIGISVQFVLGMADTALCTVMMDKSQLETAGTDYTIQASTVYFGGIVGVAIGGAIADVVGYAGLFLVSMAIAVISVATIAINFKQKGIPFAKTS